MYIYSAIFYYIFPSFAGLLSPTVFIMLHKKMTNDTGNIISHFWYEIREKKLPALSLTM